MLKVCIYKCPHPCLLDIYEKSVKLLENYFNIEEDEDATLAPATNGGMFTFGGGAAAPPPPPPGAGGFFPYAGAAGAPTGFSFGGAAMPPPPPGAGGFNFSGDMEG